MNALIEEREIRHFHLFHGLGGGAKGFNRGRAEVGNMRAKFRCIGGVDNDPAAVRDFEKLAGVPGTCLDMFDRQQYIDFHGCEPPADWREAMPADIRRAAHGERPHIVFLSSPCLPSNGLVITDSGARRISTINTGDRVLTHAGRYMPVTHVGSRMYEGTMYGFRLNGTVDCQWFTNNHPLWVRRVERNQKTDRKRALGEAKFMDASQVRLGDRIGFPIDQEVDGTAQAFIDSFGNPQECIKGGKSTVRYAKSEHVAVLEKVVDLRSQAICADLWFLIGCYLGDGWRRLDEGVYTVLFAAGAEDGPLFSQITNAISYLGMTYSVDREGGPKNVKIRVSSKHLHAICGAFGDGCESKAVPPALFSLELDLVEALVSGYRETDGSEQGKRKARNELQARWKIASVSLQLLRDFQRLLLRMGDFASIHRCWPGGPQTIMGREVQTLPRWELNYRFDPKKRTVFEFTDGAVWVRVRDIQTRITKERVWNLSVAEDDTFCVPMMATHNCKGFSGLLSEKKSTTAKYQALNRLTLRGIWLMLEAWPDDPPELIIFENVPRIATRGRWLLDQIEALLAHYRYAFAETEHDCGEIGGLGQHRRRFLLVGRHIEKVPPFLYEPPKRPLRSVGDILSRMPLPNDLRGGAMHRIPNLQWKTWVRLAFVEAGSDWRSLNKLRVVNGKLADYLVVPDTRWEGGGRLGVSRWTEPSGTIAGASRPENGPYSVADPRQEAFDRGFGVCEWQQPAAPVQGRSMPSNGEFSVADPRFAGHEFGQFGVRRWDEPSGTVTSQRSPGQGPFSVADPRTGLRPKNHQNLYRVVRWEGPSNAVTGSDHVSGGAPSIADPRPPMRDRAFGKFAVSEWAGQTGTVIGGDDSGAYAVADPRAHDGAHGGKYRVTPFDQPSGTVIAESGTGNGGFAVADPRILHRDKGDNYLTAGQYGVIPWDDPSYCVSSSAQHDSGPWNVADPRLPSDTQKMLALIRSLDGTWHRPFTTLELAALQSLVDPEDLFHGPFDLYGNSDSSKRERIGNAVPPRAAQAIANMMGETLLLAWSGESFTLSALPVWVRPVAVALSVKTPEAERL